MKRVFVLGVTVLSLAGTALGASTEWVSNTPPSKVAPKFGDYLKNKKANNHPAPGPKGQKGKNKDPK